MSSFWVCHKTPFLFCSLLKRRMSAHGAIVLSTAHSTLYLHSDLLSILLSKLQRVRSVCVEILSVQRAETLHSAGDYLLHFFCCLL